MTDKDFAVRAFLCRMDDSRDKPNVECLFCPYGMGGDYSKDVELKDIECNLLKLYADIGTLLRESKQP